MFRACLGLITSIRAINEALLRLFVYRCTTYGKSYMFCGSIMGYYVMIHVLWIHHEYHVMIHEGHWISSSCRMTCDVMHVLILIEIRHDI